MAKWTKRKLIAFEKKVETEFLRGKINCPIHMSGGNETQLIEIFKDIKKYDWVVSTHRNHYHYLLKGGSSAKLLAELKGCKHGCCSGSGRSMHVYDTGIKFISTGIVGGGCAIAVGIAMAIKRAGGKEHVWCFIGDGAEDSGHYWEAVRYAYAADLPVVFVTEDNKLSIDSTHTDRWGGGYPIIMLGEKNLRYTYVRTFPHVGVGTHVSF